MRNRVIALVLAMSMGGCASMTATGIANIIADAQQVAETTCSVIPTALSILALFNTGAFVTADAIATAICARVGVAPASAKFHGVKGHFGKVWSPHVVIVNGIPVNFL